MQIHEIKEQSWLSTKIENSKNYAVLKLILYSTNTKAIEYGVFLSG